MKKFSVVVGVILFTATVLAAQTKRVASKRTASATKTQPGAMTLNYSADEDLDTFRDVLARADFAAK